MHLVADKYEQISEDCRGPVRRELLRLQAMVEACHQFRVYGLGVQSVRVYRSGFIEARVYSRV